MDCWTFFSNHKLSAQTFSEHLKIKVQLFTSSEVCVDFKKP